MTFATQFVCATQLFPSTVAPFIRIRNSKIRVGNLRLAVLECEVEAYPEPDVFWEVQQTGRLLNDSNKYQITVYDKRDVYKVFCVIAVDYGQRIIWTT